MEIVRYIQFWTQGPEFWIPEDAPGLKRGQMPKALSGVTALMMLGYSEAQAWDCPIGKGEWLKAARGVHNGDDLDFIEPLPEEMENKIRLCKAQMEALKEAIESGGDAVGPATVLAENNLLTQQAVNAVKEWQKANRGQREAMMEMLAFYLPILTEKGVQDG